MEFVAKNLAVTALFVSVGVSAAPTTKLTLSESTLTAPFNLTHPVITADLLPAEGKELVTFGIDQLSSRWMAIYALQQGQYQLTVKLELPQFLHSFDITQQQAGMFQQLYFLSQDKLHLFEPSAEGESGQINAITDIRSLSFNTRPDYLSQGEFIADLNGDDLDDIIIPDFTQTHLLLAKKEGGFSQQVLAIKPQSRLFENGATYTQSKLYSTDLNLDGINDIVKVGEGELALYKQVANGMFSPVAEYVSVRQPISDINWWNRRDAYGEQLDQSELVYHKVEALNDINNDGITDLVLRYTKSSGVFDRVNDYEVYLGQNQQGKLVFPKVASSVVKAEGTLTGLEFVDIDNDEKVEVMVSGFDIGVTQIIGALLSGSIDQDVHLFKMNSQGHFALTPNMTQDVELNFSLSSGQSGGPVVKLADMNGDGLKDLILSESDDTLKVYLGLQGNKLFATAAQKYQVKLPQEGEMLKTDDLNGDGKHDIIIKYGRLDSKLLLNQFKVLLVD
ncbi:FG-GAP repeat domain-containing protein [Shewanella youngdeokensis]|uniref:VCBS repeat-containing protein n=1 Tax=Shewanella youngdeokensis TaxID=2999068 RepID=A0ABZ0JWP6_9GAMM|nr:VCBS repeat-containing protein [Shewanella sp. DAU334]